MNVLRSLDLLHPKQVEQHRIIFAFLIGSITNHITDYESTLIAQNILCSKVMSDSGWRPTQARKMFVRAPRCLAKALTTGVPGGVKGA